MPSACHNSLVIESCSASSEYPGYSCEKTIDGDPSTYWSTYDYWSTSNQAQRPWINISLENDYKLEIVNIKQPNEEDYRLKDISLAFSHGISIDYVLKNTQDWNEVVLPNSPISNFIRITGKSRHITTNDYIGFADIQVFGCSLGNA